MSLSEKLCNSHMDYYYQAHQAGALDVKTKQLIHICMTLAFRCEP